MPSPRGTNIEGLTMPGPVAAYDAALSDDDMQKLKSFLETKLEDDDLATAMSMLGEDDDATPGMAGDRARVSRVDYDALFPHRNRLK